MSRIINIPGSDSSDFYNDVAAGKIEGLEGVSKFGSSQNVGTSWVDICSTGGNLTYLTTASQMEAVSSDATDTVAGVAARKVRIYGLDANFNEIDEEIELNGTTASTVTTQSFLRVFRAIVTEVGAYGAENAGDITIRLVGAGITQSFIPALHSQTQSMGFTVPRGHNACMLGIALHVATSKVASVRLVTRSNNGGTGAPFKPWRVLFIFEGAVGSNPLPFSLPTPISATTDIRMQAKASSGSIQVSGQYQMIMEKAGAGV